MGNLIGMMLGVFLVIVILEISIFLALPLYLAGKITKIQHEKFTYLSCVWTGFVTALIASFLAGIVNFALVRFGLSDDIIKWIMIPVGIASSLFVMEYLLKKNYLISDLQAIKTYVLFFIFSFLINAIALFLTLLILGINMFSFLGMGSPPYCEKLLTSDVYSKDELLETSIVRDCKDEFEILLKEVPDLNVLVDGTSTYLSSAIIFRRADMLRTLVDAGADVNFQDEDGYTPLMIAVALDTGEISDETKETVKYLIEKGADTTIKNEDEKTVFDFADDEMEEYLKTLGVEVLDDDGNGEWKEPSNNMLSPGTGDDDKVKR